MALGSGGPEAKAAAADVTDDVDKDGLYNAFVHLGLILTQPLNKSESPCPFRHLPGWTGGFCMKEKK